MPSPVRNGVPSTADGLFIHDDEAHLLPAEPTDRWDFLRDPPVPPACNLDGCAGAPACSRCRRCGAHCRCYVCTGCSNRFLRPEDANRCDDCGLCLHCCKHPRCEGCDKQITEAELALRCPMCTCMDAPDHRCCSCTRCSSCGKTRLGLCGTCGRCPICCEHRPRVVRFKHEGDLPFHDDAEGLRRGALPARYISAEIEAAGARKSGRVAWTVRKWGGSIVRDGSLPDDGFEINTAPARGGAWDRQVREICSALREVRAFTDDSCGLHLHVDARDLHYWDIRRFMRLWIRLESGFYRAVAPERDGNDFCRRTARHFGRILSGERGFAVKAKGGGKSSSRFRRAMADVLYGRIDTRGVRGDKHASPSHYWGCNLHSWMMRGTIEFRMHEGTLNPLEIIRWGRLCAAAVEASKCSDAEAADLTRMILPDAEAKLLTDMITAREEAEGDR